MCVCVFEAAQSYRFDLAPAIVPFAPSSSLSFSLSVVLPVARPLRNKEHEQGRGRSGQYTAGLNLSGDENLARNILVTPLSAFSGNTPRLSFFQVPSSTVEMGSSTLQVCSKRPFRQSTTLRRWNLETCDLITIKRYQVLLFYLSVQGIFERYRRMISSVAICSSVVLIREVDSLKSSDLMNVIFVETHLFSDRLENETQIEFA